MLREAESLGEIAGRLEVHPNMLGRWKNKAVKEMHTIFEDEKAVINKKHEVEKQELYAQIGELSSKFAWLKMLPSQMKSSSQFRRHISPFKNQQCSQRKQARGNANETWNSHINQSRPH